MRIITAYQCEYCKKVAKTVKTIEKHEKNCFFNPINKACGSCINIQVCFTKGVSNCKEYHNNNFDFEEVL